MEQAKLEKIAEALKDEEFANKVFKTEKKEDLITAFAEKGLELSVEEIDELVKQGQEIISSGKLDQIKEALSEDELISVSGGWNSNVAVANAKAFGKGLINPSSDITSSVKEIFEAGNSSASFEHVGSAVGASIRLAISIAANCMKSS